MFSKVTPAPGAVLGAEVFVLGQFVEADELRAVQRLAIDFAAALDANQAVSAVVFDGALHAGFHGQFLGGEELFAVHFAVNDPAIDITFLAGVGNGNGFKIMVIFEVLVRRCLPSRAGRR